MTDKSMQGTGDEFWRVDLGEIGDLVAEDDGDNDSYTHIAIEDPDGSMISVEAAVQAYRQDHGDQALADALSASNITGDDDRSRPPVAFQCDVCGRTWPGKKRTINDDGEEVCPNCETEDDD